MDLVGLEKKPLVVVESLILDLEAEETKFVEVEGMRQLVGVWWWKVEKKPLVVVETSV